jgi:multidrug efflux pump subunit AcrB
MVLSASLAFFRMVPLKMLPFDNKNEFQIVIDMPEGTTLETTDTVVRVFESYLRRVSEATNYVSYVGTASPIDFNGLVRHYYLREGSNVADIRINLTDKARRKHQSHEVVLRLRKDLEKIAERLNANIKIVEVPPGPPVIATIVAEVYGDPDRSYQEMLEASSHIKGVMSEEPFVVDIDDIVETPRNKIDFVLDKEKSALHGVSTDAVIHTMRLALSGTTPATVHLAGERQSLLIRLILPRAKRSSVADLYQISVKTATGHMVQLGELGTFVEVR